MSSQVYFTRTITPESLVQIFDRVGVQLPGKVAVKVHSGEQGNQNYLRPEFLQPLVEHVKGTVVECNTAYAGARNSTAKHQQLITEHGWDQYFSFDLLDADPAEDLPLPAPVHDRIDHTIVGGHLKNYDSLLVVSHFKGHAMGGFGGALKQLSIGCASTAGKAYIHTAGATTDQFALWDQLPEQDHFLESMADAAGAVVNHFNGALGPVTQPKIVFINVLKNISVDCDCDGHAHAPCMADLGVVASTDPVAIDQACLDLAQNSGDPGAAELFERINSRHGVHTVEVAAAHGLGSRTYELVEL